MDEEEGYTGSEKERGGRRRDQVWRDTCSGYRALCVRVCVRQVWSPKRTFAVTPAAMASANAVVFHSSGLRLAATWQADMASKRRSRGISVRSFTTLVSCFAAFFFFVGIAVMEQRSAVRRQVVTSEFGNSFLPPDSCKRLAVRRRADGPSRWTPCAKGGLFAPHPPTYNE